MKKLMKKFVFSLIFFVVLVLTLASCGFNKEKSEEAKINIVVTIFPQYDFVRQLTEGVDSIKVNMLIPPGADVHCFEPTPQDFVDIEKSDLLIYCGGKSDAWIEKILKSSKKDAKKTMSMVDVVKSCSTSNKLKQLIEKDEHVWTSPLNCITIVKSLTKKLCEIDGKNALKYNENMEKYVQKLLKLHESFKDVVAERKRDFIVFADRFAFLHFVNEYGLKYYALYNNCNSKADVSPKDVSKIIEKIKKNKVPLILKLDQSEYKLAESISKETGVKVKTFYSCHNCSKKDFENGETVLDMFSKNVKTLKEALH